MSKKCKFQAEQSLKFHIGARNLNVYAFPCPKFDSMCIPNIPIQPDPFRQQLYIFIATYYDPRLYKKILIRRIS